MMSSEQDPHISEGHIPVNNIHSNTEQTLISITEDKLRLILNEHLTSVERKNSWIAPLGIFLTILVVLATSEFKDFLVSKNTWEAIFIISAFLFGGWFVVSLRHITVSVSVDDVVRKIKNEA